MGLRTVRAYLLSSVFQELGRTALLEFILTFGFPDKKVGMGYMDGCGYLSMTVVHRLFDLSSLSALKNLQSALGLDVLQLQSLWHGECRGAHLHLSVSAARSSAGLPLELV